MTLADFLHKLNVEPATVEFADTMSVIEAYYHFSPAGFRNGELMNAAGQNSGSCKLFAFAQLQRFSKEQTLNCFGAYYRKDVLQNPDGTDHGNIRNFIRFGWEGIRYDSQVLQEK